VRVLFSGNNEVDAFFILKQYSSPTQGGTMCSLIDSRKSERVKCKMDILHNTPPADFFYNGQLRNYSKKGLYFESNEHLLPKNEISILLKKSASGKIHVLDVKIIWCKELQDS
jgi:hypothetical protein